MAEKAEGGGGAPTTVPPPFDPQEYARDSEVELRSAADQRPTAPMAPPPLTKRVRLAVPISDLAWFGLSEETMALVRRIDGEHTLLEMLEGASEELLAAVSKLHDAGALRYED